MYKPAILVIMSVNSFECHICGKRTLHDEISYSEHQAIRNSESFIGDYKIPPRVETALNNAISYSGITKAAKYLSSFNGFWKCRECGHSYARKKNGEIDWDMNI